MPYFLIFNTGAAVASVFLYVIEIHWPLSFMTETAISVLSGLLTVLGFAFWWSR